MGFLSKIFGKPGKTSSGPPAEQMPFLKNMWSNAQNMQGQLSNSLANMNPQGIANGLAQQGQGYANTLAQGGQQLAPFAQQGYGGMQMAGLQDQMQQYLGGAFKQAGDAAQMAGSFGGTGQGIQQNQAIQDAGRTLFQGAGGIMQQDLMRQQQAAGQMGQQQLLGNQAAMGSLGGLYDLQVNAPMQSLFQPLVTQGGINQGYNTSAQRGGGGGVWGNFVGPIFSGGGGNN